MAAVSYLEDYLDTLESLPLELARNFTLIRELDSQSQDTMISVQSEIQSFMDSASDLSRDERIAKLTKLSGIIKGSLQFGHDKVALAVQTYDMVDRHIRRLDEDLAKFEEEQMTGPKLLSAAGQRDEPKMMAPPLMQERMYDQAIAMSGANSAAVAASSAAASAAAAALRGTRRTQNAIETPTKKRRAQDDRDVNGRESPIGTPAQPQPPALRPSNGGSTSSNDSNSGPLVVAQSSPGPTASTGPIAISSSSSSNGSKKSNVKSKKSTEIKIGKDKFTVDMAIDPNEPTYCICKQVSYGEMIACDNDDCPIEWFHYTCVGLTDPVKGKWFCPICVEKRKVV